MTAPRPFSSSRRLARVSPRPWALVLLGVCCFSEPAHSTRIHPAQLYNTSVPANGVLRFTSLNDLTVVVLAADGSPVPGSFIAPGVWRPDEPFIPGTYSADLGLEANPGIPVQDAVFEVTAPIDVVDADLVGLEVTSRVEMDAQSILERVCCLAAVAPSPLCVVTAYETKQVVNVAASTSEVMQWQLEVRSVTTMQEGEFTRGHWPVTGSPEQLCGVVEVFSWLDESTNLVRSCIPNPKPELGRVEEAVSGFGTGYDCTIPPAGYETLWCEERRTLCEPLPVTSEVDPTDEIALACEHYPRVCNGGEGGVPPTVESGTPQRVDAGSPLEPTAPTTSAETETQADTGTETSSASEQHAEPGLRAVDSAEGCSFAIPRQAPAGTRMQALIVAIGTGCITIYRRRKRAARDVY